MNHMSCQGARLRLSAFHDGELPAWERVGVQAHLRECESCDREAAVLRAVGEVLRDRAARSAAIYEAGLEGLQSEILNRNKVEREESWAAQFGLMFEDMRLGFAALGSTAASVVSIAIMVGIFYFGPRSERPDSLSGMLQTMSPQAVGVDVRDLVGRDIVEPTTQDREAMSVRAMNGGGPYGGEAGDTGLSEEDAVFTLAAMVTRQGRIASLEVAKSAPGGGTDRDQVLRLLDQVSRARLEPTRVGGSPVASRKLWVLAHTTVRAKLPVLPKQSAMPAAIVGSVLT